jgi:nucleotide-binding universal stress UspA family protein
LFKKILVAIDGSNLAYASLDYALDLAKKYSAEVMVLTVVEMPSNSVLAQGAVFTPVSSQSHREKLENYHKEILIEAAKKAEKSSPQIHFTTKLVEGRPAEKIVETAKLESFDLIVMGSRGLGGIKEFFLGSVSDRVADEAPCPVLIINDFSQD